MMYIPVILGTAREGRQSERVARFVLEEALGYGLESEIIDVRHFRTAATDNTEKTPQAKKLAGKISRADGLIIVSPEYNRGYPGELKMMLDLIYEQYARKPVGFCGVSSGDMGGSRCVEQLRLVAVGLQMMPLKEALHFPGVQDLFDAEGRIKNRASYAKGVKNFLDKLTWHAAALKTAREK
jgi:NAD(P)H-dependent FMN reductase